MCATLLARDDSKQLQVVETHAGTERLGVADGPGPSHTGVKDVRSLGILGEYVSSLPLRVPSPFAYLLSALVKSQPTFLLLALSDRCHVGPLLITHMGCQPSRTSPT